jgi:hypothetical protein
MVVHPPHEDTSPEESNDSGSSGIPESLQKDWED